MPPAFDGISGSFKDWLRRYEQCALAAGWSTQQQAERLGLYLKEPFLSGWDAYAKKVNFEEDKKSLLKIFDHVRPHQALKQFQELRWSKGQHPALYAAALQRHLNRYYTKEKFPELSEADRTKNMEEMIIDRLKADLPPMVRFQLLLKEPKNLKEACIMCDSVLALDDANSNTIVETPAKVATAAGVFGSQPADDSTDALTKADAKRIEQKLDRILGGMRRKSGDPKQQPDTNVTSTVALTRPRKFLAQDHPTYSCPNKKFSEGCYWCGKTGHLARDCYQNPNKVIHERCLPAGAKIQPVRGLELISAQGHSFDLLGAVALTLSLYDSTNLDNPCLPEADPPPPGPDLPPDIVVPMVFLVVKACVHPILLGSDFLAHYRMSVVYQELGPPLLQGVLKDRPIPSVTDAGRGYSVSATRRKPEPLKVPTRMIESLSNLQKKKIPSKNLIMPPEPPLRGPNCPEVNFDDTQASRYNGPKKRNAKRRRRRDLQRKVHKKVQRVVASALPWPRLIAMLSVKEPLTNDELAADGLPTEMPIPDSWLPPVPRPGDIGTLWPPSGVTTDDMLDDDISGALRFAVPDLTDEVPRVILPSIDLSVYPNKKRFAKLCNEYSDLFSSRPGKCDSVEHAIPLKSDKPFSQKPRPIPHKWRDEVKSLVDKLLEEGMIRPSTSPYRSPCVYVPKKNGSVRMCIDFRALNALTEVDSYTLPRLDDVQEHLAGSKVFSTLDLQSGYWQCLLRPQDIHKTAFCPGPGFPLYEWVRMPFGLCSAGATFQRPMDQVLNGLPFVRVYLDDILVFSPDAETHEDHLRQVFARLRAWGLTLSAEKCEFGCPSVPYLGHIFDGNGMRPDPTKVEAILRWPRPGNVAEIRSFLGLAGYYRNFVPNFSDVARPIQRLVSEVGSETLALDTYWGQEQEDSFRALKLRLAALPFLAYPDFGIPFELYTDASDYAIGAVLMQEGRPLGFFNYFTRWATAIPVKSEDTTEVALDQFSFDPFGYNEYVKALAIHLEDLVDLAHASSSAAAQAYYDKKATARQFYVGQRVLVRRLGPQTGNKLEPKWSPGWFVVGQMPGQENKVLKLKHQETLQVRVLSADYVAIDPLQPDAVPDALGIMRQDPLPRAGSPLPDPDLSNAPGPEPPVRPDVITDNVSLGDGYPMDPLAGPEIPPDPDALLRIEVDFPQPQPRNSRQEPLSETISTATPDDVPTGRSGEPHLPEEGSAGDLDGRVETSPAQTCSSSSRLQPDDNTDNSEFQSVPSTDSSSAVPSPPTSPPCEETAEAPATADVMETAAPSEAAGRPLGRGHRTRNPRGRNIVPFGPCL
ncbi:retrovirus polyprotein, putative [Perkinsus marinus ATCC 50983]|uniref:Retrovirus polyprotein, putative n=1 Tax=Perkinsus marinus (strain ATCC 50983 / TXsc) TaxID=423536 RepID=C5LVC1_PERM5|nr:retrovirus polyprotein, putative [Perkinsus marinus ATCC 50983]EEQ99359.1 retrovirus polyprotein, putative [Perkinsus marinus ATCC 50983]|eukprot:XP_002766642.1 retrovirus polyprotein, putative [Perkinsus marinus ATCC 50983]